MHMRRLSLVAVLVGIGLVGLVSVATSAAQTPAEQNVAQCGGAGNSMADSFEIPAANEFWDYFPNAGLAPELSADDSPAYVVVFDGDYKAPAVGFKLGTSASDVTLSNVVCVVQSNGIVNVYFDVPQVGARRP